MCIGFAFSVLGCGNSATQVSATGATGEPCSPGPSASVVAKDVPGGEDRRGEALVLYLSGVDQLSISEANEGEEPNYGDPNYGGVWGDRAGGWVAAVTDCSAVDPDEVAALAGGSGSVRLIRVAYSFQEVNSFRDVLVTEIRDAGIKADVRIDSTLTGRMIVVVTPPGERFPDGLGSDVPSEIIAFEQGEIFQSFDSDGVEPEGE